MDKVAVEVTDEIHMVGEGRADWNRSCWEKNCEETDYCEVFSSRYFRSTTQWRTLPKPERVTPFRGLGIRRQRGYSRCCQAYIANSSICIALRQMPRNACIQGYRRFKASQTMYRTASKATKVPSGDSLKSRRRSWHHCSTWPQCVKLVRIMGFLLSHQARALPLKHEERFLQSVCGLAFSIVSSDFVKRRQRTKLCTIQ
jgi:hypothetical protein